ncbi:hypothetical protein ACS0TY_012940 [Phlomoides rotata]
MKRRWSKRSLSHLATEPATAEEPSLFKIVNIEYPISSGEPNHRKIGGFLEICYYCKQRLSSTKETYMYGNFRGFCSIECRENQMEEEGFNRKSDENQPKTKNKKNAVGCSGQSSSLENKNE